MKTIFEHIKGKEWDWFGTYNVAPEKRIFYVTKDKLVINYSDKLNKEIYSPADLLANKSWCEAVWGKTEKVRDENGICLHCEVHWQKETHKESVCKHVYYPDNCKVCQRKAMGYPYYSEKAFQILQQEGEEACITYIKETMI